VSNQSMDLFLEACGARGPLHLSVEYQGRPESAQHVLDQPFALIGRDPKADIVLKEGQVSRHHVYLQCIGGRLFCIDLESRTGTHWDRGSKRAGWLEAKQAIRIGPYWVRRLEGNANGDDRPEDDSDQPHGQALSPIGLPEVTLEFINRGEKAPTWRMTPMLSLIGKAPECRVHLVGRSVANYHCSLVRTPLGVWVVDLLGPGGVWVQDVMVRSALLEDGDHLQVGRFSMRIHYDTPTGVPTRYTEPGRLSAERSFNGASHPQSQDNEAEDESPDETRPPPALLSASSFQNASLKETSTPSNHDLVMLPAEHLQGEAAHNLLVPIVQQFGVMQQQMFDQFQQAMMMMFQMFSSMHKDQMGVIREELDRLQELTEEIQLLQSQLAKSAPGAQPAAAAAPQAAGMAPPRPAQPPFVPRPQTTNDAARKSSPPPSPEAQPRQGTNGADTGSAPSAAGQSQADIHAWLTHRLVAIQAERQTRWQKIVGFLTGKRNEDANP
jgi:pSer/pThr/pTyr-binding forkhead associated (FHA) protein